LEENRFLGCISETTILPCFSFRWQIVPCKYAVYVDCMPFVCRLMMLKALRKHSKFCKISSNLLPFSSTSDVLIENLKSPSYIPPVIFALEGLLFCSIFSSIVGNTDSQFDNKRWWSQVSQAFLFHLQMPSLRPVLTQPSFLCFFKRMVIQTNDIRRGK
jgi:hypothetical protein